jgi:hypothetical protein
MFDEDVSVKELQGWTWEGRREVIAVGELLLACRIIAGGQARVDLDHVQPRQPPRGCKEAEQSAGSCTDARGWGRAHMRCTLE